MKPLKRILYSLCFLLVFSSLTNAQISPDFTATDCGGTSHNLYSELDSGKVIVLCWVMPCTVCVFPALDVYTIVQGYQLSHPNTVRLYLCDDLANTSCSLLESWADSVGIMQSASSLRFVDTAVRMSNYGNPGMPKTVVIGGAGHTIFYNEINAVNAVDLQNSIDSALLTTGVSEPNSAVSSLNVFPNPSDGTAEIGFVLEKTSDVTIELFNLAGEKLEVVFSGTLYLGKNQVKLNAKNYPEGMYLLKISEGNASRCVGITLAY